MTSCHVPGAGVAGYVRGLPEIPRLHFDGIDGEIGNDDIARFPAVWRQTARINPGTAVVHFIAQPMRQWERNVSIANARERRRQVGQVLGDVAADAGLPEVVQVPHSRVNDVPEAALVEAGYRIVIGSGSAGAGWAVAARECGGGLFVLCHGHPEYATPECDDVAELVIHDKAGERIVEDLLHQAEKRLRGGVVGTLMTAGA